MMRKKLKSPPFLWQSACLDGPSLELASQSLIGQSHLLHYLDRFTRNDSTLMYPKEETRLTSVPLIILLPLSYKSTLHS